MPTDPDVDLVLAAYAAFARGDVETAVSAMHPQVEWIEPNEFPNGGRRVGPDAVAEYLAASRASWRELTSEPLPRRVGEEIVVVHHVRGILEDGSAHEASVADVFSVREGAVVRMRAYADPEEAFAAAPIRAWIDGYLSAWSSNRRDEIEALFATDAEYRIEPYAEPWRGRIAIVAGWLEHRDEPGDTEFEWMHLGRADDLWIVEGGTRYRSLAKTFSNLWLVRLDEAGRCAEFREWWMERPRGLD
jgi:ketosteroid isomerase-like protein